MQKERQRQIEEIIRDKKCAEKTSIFMLLTAVDSLTDAIAELNHAVGLKRA